MDNTIPTAKSVTLKIFKNRQISNANTSINIGSTLILQKVYCGESKPFGKINCNIKYIYFNKRLHLTIHTEPLKG